MRVPVKIGKDFRRTIATNWNDVTVKEFHLLRLWAETDGEDMSKLYAIILNTTSDIIAKLNYGSIKAVIDPRIAWLNIPQEFSRRKPDIIEINDKIFTIPDSIDLISLGQYIGLDQYLQKLSEIESVHSDWERMRVVVLIIMWKDLFPDLDFTIERLKARFEVIDNCTYLNTFALELFFWTNYWNLKKKEKGGLRAWWMKIRIQRERTKSRLLAN